MHVDVGPLLADRGGDGLYSFRHLAVPASASEFVKSLSDKASGLEIGAQLDEVTALLPAVTSAVVPVGTSALTHDADGCALTADFYLTQLQAATAYPKD